MTTQEEPEAPAEDAGEAPPIPRGILRRERRFLALLGGALVVSGLIGWMTIPTDEELLRRAGTHRNMEARIEAMNSLVLRGYWHERPKRDLAEFLKTSPPEVRQFIADMHGGLLKR